MFEKLREWLNKPGIPTANRFTYLALTRLESRDVPAQYAVNVISPGSGLAGSTAATISGTLSLNSQLPTNSSGAAIVEASSIANAISQAIIGTITVQYGNATMNYSVGPSTVGATASEHKPFLVSGSAIYLEDLASYSGGSDWDYDDRSWGVTAAMATNEEGGGTVPVVPLPSIDLDVTNDAQLTDPADRVVNYLPGFKAGTRILSKTAEQQMKVVAEGLTPNTIYKFRTVNTSKLVGIASNALSQATSYPSTGTDNDFVLVKANGAVIATDNTDVDVTTDATGKAVIDIRCRDFGGRTTVEVRNAAATVVASLKIPLDTDGDNLPDLWESLYNYGPGQPMGFDKNKKQTVNGIDDGNRDDDRNEGGQLGKNAGDRIPAFDEYRGFFASNSYKRTDPFIKQIYIYSPDSDPFLVPAQNGNNDGLNRTPGSGPAIKVGAYANDLDAEILLLDPGEFDGAAATLGDVNYNSPAPYLGIKQKYVWVISTVQDEMANYGSWPGITADQTRGPNQVFPFRSPQELPVGNANVGKKAALIHLGVIRTDVAFVEGEGSLTKFGGSPPKAMLFRGNGGLPSNALRDPDRYIDVEGETRSLFYFAAADKIRWNDRNGNAYWDRDDELWIDFDSNGKYNEGDRIIFDFDNNLAFNTSGILLDNSTEFRYVRTSNVNTPVDYTEGDFIYTTHFNSSLYIASRDQALAHEALGHPTELQHTNNQLGDGYSIMHSDTLGSYTASGMLVQTQTGGMNYIDPPQTFRDADQDTQLQLRE